MPWIADMLRVLGLLLLSMGCATLILYILMAFASYIRNDKGDL